MAKKLQAFPGDEPQSRGRYPWKDWTDGSVWEIRKGSDYEVKTENMRVNLHMQADSLGRKVKTKKINDDDGEGLVFQYAPDMEAEAVEMAMKNNPEEAREAMKLLNHDAIEIYEKARREVTIERSDGRTQKYAPTRYKQQIEKGNEEGALVPTIAKIIRKPTLGFGHLENANRPDLMLETLVLDASKPYHRFFTKQTVEIAQQRMDEYYAR